MKLAPVYETERLILRAPTPDMAAPIVEYFARNRDFLQPFEAQHADAFFMPEGQLMDIELDIEARHRGTGYRYWIEKKSELGRIIGSVALGNIVYGAFLSCFLGYRMDAGELRKGYMVEAAGRMVEIAFDELGLHRVEANIMPNNAASMGIAKKLGFTEEGFARKYLKINGKWEDHVHMVKLNENV